MKPAADELASEDSRLLEAARDYLAEVEAGRIPDRAAYIARYPDLASELAECFDDIDFTHAGALALRPSRPTPKLDQPENALGDYRIIRELGRGGMGVVYEAEQVSLTRRVALTVLPSALGLDARQLQRFQTEAHAAAQLHHPNIVPVHGVGCENGIHFYAMQLIQGRTLDNLIRELRGANVSQGHTDSEARTAKVEAPSPSTAVVETRTSRNTVRSQDDYASSARMACQVAEALDYAH